MTCCSSLENRPVSTIKYNNGNISRSDIDTALERRLKVSAGRTSRVGQKNLLHAQIDIENVKSFSVPIRYKFYWVLSDGSIDDSSSNWKNDTVSGGQTITLSDIASDSRVNDFKIEIRRLK